MSQKLPIGNFRWISSGKLTLELLESYHEN